MNTDRIDIFHSADDNAVISTVSHDFEFYFFPAGDAAFNQNLIDRRKLDAAVGDFFHFIAVMRNAAACTAQCISRADDDRVSDLICESNSRFQVFENFRFRNRLMDFFHSFLKEFSVFCMLDCMERRAEEFYIILVQHTCISKLYCHVKADLSAKRGKKGIRTFSLDDFRYEWERNRFDIYTVSNIYVGHDCGWIAVDKNNFHAFFSKRAAGLCTSVVKLCSLSDDNRTRANDENFFHIFIYHF